MSVHNVLFEYWGQENIVVLASPPVGVSFTWTRKLSSIHSWIAYSQLCRDPGGPHPTLGWEPAMLPVAEARRPL